MNLHELIKDFPAYDAGQVHSPMTALRFISEPPFCGAVEYEIFDHVVIHDPSTLEFDKKSNKLMYVVDKLPYSDIIREITSDKDIRVRLGNEELHPEGLLIANCLGQYARKGVVVYLDFFKNTPVSFFIKYRCYLFQLDLVKRIRMCEEVSTNTHVYRHGMILPKSEESPDGSPELLFSSN